MKIFYDKATRSFTTDDIEGLFREWNEKVNSFNFNAQEEVDRIISDPNLRYLYLSIAMEWVRFHYEHLVEEDEMNQKAMRTIRTLGGSWAFSDYYALFDEMNFGYDNMAKEFVSLAPTMHRALMQTLSFFFFCFLANSCVGINEEMIDEKGEDWWKENAA